MSGVALRIRNSPSDETALGAKMTEPERAELVELLLESEREFMQELEGVNERQWSFKLRPDRSHRVDAPGVSQPPSAMPREQLLSRFIDQRARVVKYASAAYPRY